MTATATAINVTVTNVTNAVKMVNAREDMTSNTTAKKLKTSTTGLNVNGSAGSHLAPPSASLPLLRVPDPIIGGSSCQDGCTGMIL